jgi:AAA domain
VSTQPEDFHFYSGDDYIELPTDPETWLIKPLVPVGGWVNIYGKPKKARKSYLALGMAWAVSSGQDRWLGFDVKRHGAVLFLQADTPRNLWRQRVADIRAAGYSMSNIHFADIKCMPYPFNIQNDEVALEMMIEEVKDKTQSNPVMIVLDTARKLHTGDENSSQDTALFMNGFEAAVGQDCAKILISHDKKGSAMDAKAGDEEDPHDNVDLMEGARGSTGVAGAVDTVIKMTPKGYMWYQGRAVGEERKKLRFEKVGPEEMGYMWVEDYPPEVEEAKRLAVAYPHASDRNLARMLTKTFPMDEEKARSIIRREKKFK